MCCSRANEQPTYMDLASWVSGTLSLSLSTSGLIAPGDELESPSLVLKSGEVTWESSEAEDCSVY